MKTFSNKIYETVEFRSQHTDIAVCLTVTNRTGRIFLAEDIPLR